MQLHHNTSNITENQPKAGDFSTILRETETVCLTSPAQSLWKIQLFTPEPIYSGEDSTAVAQDPDKWNLYSWRSITPNLLPRRFPALEAFPALPRTWQVFWRNELYRELLHRICTRYNSLMGETIYLERGPGGEAADTGRKKLLLYSGGKKNVQSPNSVV